VKVAVTGATGTIGRAVVEQLRARGDEPVALSRDPDRARDLLGDDVEAHAWRDPKAEPAPAEALRDAEGVIHLLGEEVSQRWSDEAKREIRDSRVLGTRNLVATLKETGPRLGTLVSQSASGFYGARGDEPLDESASGGDDFLANVVEAWEAEARKAEDEAGVRVALCRTGVVLSPGGGALAKMMPFFKAGVGGPVAGGRQYVPWIHLDDAAGAMVFALHNEAASGPLNVVAPEGATNKEFSKALGRAINRPALAPVPGFAVKALYGEMATIVTTGAHLVPRRLEELGYEFEHPGLDEAMRSATA
jgi:uncharacterized protein (TIGR01777 family)